MWHFFLTKKLVPHYINPNRSLVQLLHLMLTGTAAFSSSPWEEPHPCLARQSMMSLFPRAGWNWRLQRGLQVDLLGGGAPLGLPDHIPAAPPQCPPRNHLDNEPSQQWGRGWEGKELSKCDIWPRMVIILTDFRIFTKKLSIGDIFSHKNWCHLPLNSHENWWTFYTTTNTPKKSISGCIRFNFLPNNHSVRHSKTHGLDKIINWQLHVMDIFISYYWQWCSDWP